MLEPLAQMSGAEEVDLFLSQIIAVHAEPVINGIIRHKLRHNPNRSGAEAGVEDLRQEAIAQLLVELQKLRSDVETNPIRDVRGLAATITYRLCAGWMRRQFPRRHALRNRIQYLLTRQAGFALWPDDNDEMKKAHLPRAALGGSAAGGPVLVVDVYDAPGDCALRGTDNMQMRLASGLPHATICAPGNIPVGPSRFIHVEQRIDARRSPAENSATPGRNRGVVLAGILATFP